MTSVADTSRFVHTTLAHDSTDELVAKLAPPLRTWLERRDRVFVNLTSARVDALRSALGADADRVRWSDTYHWAPHPARRLRAIQELVEGEERHGSGDLRFVGECAFSVDMPDLVAEWVRFDALLNDAMADVPMTMVCTYDADAVPGDVTARARRAHPMLGVDPIVLNDDYMGGPEVLDIAWTLPPPPPTACRVGERVTPARARTLVREVLGTVGADGPASQLDVVDDLAVVVTELVTNAWQVGAGSIGVWCWRDGGEMGVQVDDDGPGLFDPRVGYRRPASGGTGGRGLWIARQLADLVEIGSSSLGTTVRARIFERSPSWAC